MCCHGHREASQEGCTGVIQLEVVTFLGLSHCFLQVCGLLSTSGSWPVPCALQQRRATVTACSTSWSMEPIPTWWPGVGQRCTRRASTAPQSVPSCYWHTGPTLTSSPKMACHPCTCAKMHNHSGNSSTCVRVIDNTRSMTANVIKNSTERWYILND